MATRGSITRQKRSSRIITRRGVKYSMDERRGEGEAYMIFVNFGTPPHYLGLYKYTKKSRIITRRGGKRES